MDKNDSTRGYEVVVHQRIEKQSDEQQKSSLGETGPPTYSFPRGNLTLQGGLNYKTSKTYYVNQVGCRQQIKEQGKHCQDMSFRA